VSRYPDPLPIILNDSVVFDLQGFAEEVGEEDLEKLANELLEDAISRASGNHFIAKALQEAGLPDLTPDLPEA
jgi:hypothetical protein